MRTDAKEAQSNWRNLAVTIVAIVALAVPVLLSLMMEPRLGAQAPTVKSAAVPQWQIDAGGKLAFDAASIKQNKSGLPPSGSRPNSNVPVDPGPTYSPNGGLFSATNEPLGVYISFAYKLDYLQLPFVVLGFPAWGNSDRFDIEARAQGNPTKDQMRLMIQSLFADRFKLVAHYETRQLPEFALVLSKAGKTGPQLQRRSDDSKCTDQSAAGLPSASCGGFYGSGVAGGVRLAGQEITMDMLAGVLNRQLDRVVVNRTGLSGLFDASLEFVPPPGQFRPQLGADTSGSDSSGSPSIFTALQDQLGLKLEATKGPVDVLVIDHVEEPSPN